MIERSKTMGFCIGLIIGITLIQGAILAFALWVDNKRG
jgi:hypothetical protein